jgi:hypothetical protein
MEIFEHLPELVAIAWNWLVMAMLAVGMVALIILMILLVVMAIKVMKEACCHDKR